jgi:hypothetical protein
MIPMLLTRITSEEVIRPPCGFRAYFLVEQSANCLAGMRRNLLIERLIPSHRPNRLPWGIAQYMGFGEIRIPGFLLRHGHCTKGIKMRGIDFDPILSPLGVGHAGEICQMGRYEDE